MTSDEFIKREIHIWGEEYIFDLLERGYEPRLTSSGYKWFYTKPLDTAPTVCYRESVGAR